MENRDRDKMSHNTDGTEAGDVNRKTSERQNDSSVDFGEHIGDAERGSTGTGATGSTGMGKGSNHQIDQADRGGNSEGRH